MDAEHKAELDSVWQEVESVFRVLEKEKYIMEAAEIGRFLNPSEEQINDDPNFLEEHILNSFLPEDAIQNVAEENEELELPKIEIEYALKYIEYLEIFELQQNTPGPDQWVLTHLGRMRRDIEARRLRKLGNQEQKKITMYFSH